MALPITINSSTPAGSDSPALGDDEFRALKDALVSYFGTPNNQSLTAQAFSLTTGGLVTVSQTPFTIPTLMRGGASQILQIQSQFSTLDLLLGSTKILSATATGARVSWHAGASANNWVDAFPAGTRMIFDQDTAPVGWARDTTTVDDRVIRIVTGSRADGGSWTVSGLTSPSHTHDLGNHTHGMSSHTHTLGTSGTVSDTDGLLNEFVGIVGGLLGTGDNTIGSNFPRASSTTGGPSTANTGTPSTNTSDGTVATISSDASWRPLHRDMILCSKN